MQGGWFALVMKYLEGRYQLVSVAVCLRWRARVMVGLIVGTLEFLDVHNAFRIALLSHRSVLVSYT